MYCTLKEAYQVPSFDPASKKLKNSCGPSSPNPVYASNPSTERTEQAAYNMEGFIGTLTPNPTYRDMQADTTYYCNAYDICDEEGQRRKRATVEGFQNAPAMKKAGPPAQRTQPLNQGQCGPLQPPPYEFPISDAAKKQYKSAFDVAIGQENPAGFVPPPQKMRQVDMSQVAGYDDDDFDLYLQTKDMKAANMPTLKSMQDRSDDSSNKTFAEAMKDFDGQVTPANAKPSQTTFEKKASDESPKDSAPAVRVLPAPVDRWSRWMDLLLFFLAGVLVIFLCDQLIRLGVMLGMRQTMDSIRPILESIEAKLASK